MQRKGRMQRNGTMQNKVDLSGEFYSPIKMVERDKNRGPLFRYFKVSSRTRENMETIHKRYKRPRTSPKKLVDWRDNRDLFVQPIPAPPKPIKRGSATGKKKNGPQVQVDPLTKIHMRIKPTSKKRLYEIGWGHGGHPYRK